MLILANLFLVAGLILVKRIKHARSSRSYRNWKQMTLWGLIAAFEISSFVQFVMDMMFVFSDPRHSCDAVIGEPLSVSYLSVKLLQRIAVSLVPVWIMLYCLRPKQRSSDLRTGADHTPVRHATAAGLGCTARLQRLPLGCARPV